MRRRHGCLIEQLEQRQLLAAIPTVIDVLALYTPGALAYHGGNLARLQSHLSASAETANLAMVNSRISALFRVVGLQPISYTGSDDLFLDRTRLANPADGFMDTAPALRNTFGADLVTLITDSTQNGGNASLPTSLAELNTGNFVFSAINVDAVQSANLTVGHEWGHNLGAGHERDNLFDPVVGLFPYSYGYRFTAADGNLYHDAMSYDPGIGLYNFANPAVNFLGSPTGKPSGDAQAADIALTFAQSTPVIANFRASAFADTTGPTATLYQTKTTDAPLGAQQFDFTLRIADPVGINASTLDSRDVTVTLPPLFGNHVLRAGMIDIEGGATAGGAYKLVSYRVILPSTAIPLDQLTIKLLAGSVADSLGNTPVGAAVAARNTAAVANIDYANSRDLGSIALNGGTTTVYESLGSFIGDGDNTYRINVASSGKLAVQLSGNTADLAVFVARDLNGNGRYDFPAERIDLSANVGAAAPEALVTDVTPGTYFVWPQGAVSTAYQLSIRQYTDASPPTATFDGTDLYTTGAPYIEYSVTYEDDQLIDGDTSRYGAAVDTTVDFGGSGFTFFYYPEPATNTFYGLTGKSQTINYRIFPSNGPAWIAADNGTYSQSIHPPTPGDFHVIDAAGNDLPTIPLGAFRISIGQSDTEAPTLARLDAPPVNVPGATAHTFTVLYDDNAALNAATFDGNDLRITGPGGFDAPASVVAIAPAPTIGGQRAVTYSFAPPGGSWDVADRGVYTISLQPNQVRDTANNAMPTGALGAFNVIVPLPGDANDDRTVNLDDFTLLAANFGQQPRGRAGGDFNYDNVVNLDDFTALASRFGQSVPMVSDVPRTVVARAPSATTTPTADEKTFSTQRIASDILE